ncbi:hypothetical protein JZ751_018736 [Albula glossodonta]|uniref:PH domain-containing protein n=1 Tax=Albula glossodonta TaxID=121402 RepID=A0A8T2NVQ7_9TELE|nr:hypothetical protein JZ751_018736 [Albula glossodonta]
MAVMSCDDISKYSMGKSGVKGSESPSYYLDHESGRYYTFMEGEGVHLGPEYDRERGRSTGVRRREKTPTHGDLRPVSMPPEYNWMTETKDPSMYKRGSRDSDNSLLRYLSDDKILVIQEEPEVPRECKRDTGRRSRKKGKSPSSPSYPISPSLLASTVRLDSGPPEGLPFPLPESNTVPLYHSFHYASLRTKTKKRTKGSLTSGSRRRISCKDLGHGDCEGWLWKKKDAKGYFTQKWKKYWFILKDSSLYCAFKACHPKIKSFFFATDCLEEMNRWMNRLGLAAIGYTPDDKVNSSSPFPEPKHGRHFSSESTYSHSSAEDSRPDGGPGSAHSSGCRSTHRERRSWQDLIETPLTSSGLHFLQTVPAEADFGGVGGYGSMAGGGRLAMSPDRRRQATLPVQRRHRPDRDGPFPLVESEEHELHLHHRAHKQRSQSLPRNREAPRGPKHSFHHPAGLSEERSEDDEVPFRKHSSMGREVCDREEREFGMLDGLQELYRTLEQASLSALGEPRPSTKQDYRRSFIKRCNDPVINDQLHHVRVLRSTLKAKEAELALINQLLEEPNLTSKKFREWKQRHHELFMDICEFGSGDNGTADLSPLATPLMSHTHSFIETHV